MQCTITGLVGAHGPVQRTEASRSSNAGEVSLPESGEKAVKTTPTPSRTAMALLTNVVRRSPLGSDDTPTAGTPSSTESTGSDD